MTTPWLRRYIDILWETDSLPSFNFFVFITFVAASLSRRIYMEWSKLAHWPNMYTILYGDSGLGKGISTAIAAQLFIHQFEDLSGHLKVIPGNVTNEWLIETMYERNQEGRDAAFLLLTEEIGTMCGQEQYKAGLVDTLTLWYTCPDYGIGRSTLKGGEQQVSAPYPNIITNGTPKTFKGLRADVITGGFLPRQFLVHEHHRRTGIPWEWTIDYSALKSMAKGLRENFKRLDEQELTTVICPKGRAYTLLNKVKRWLDNQIAYNPIEEERAWYNRYMEKLLTLTIVTGFIEDKDVRVLDEECLAQSIEVLNYITPGVFEAYSSITASPYGTQQQMIAKMIRDAKRGGQWLHVVMAVAVQRMHIKPDQAQQIVNALKATGLIRSEQKALNDNRQGHWLTWVWEKDNGSD